MDKPKPVIRVVPENRGSGVAKVIFTREAWSLLTGGKPVTNIRADVRDTLLCLSITDKARPETELDFAARILVLKEYEAVAVTNFWGQHDYVLTSQNTGVFMADLSDPLPEAGVPKEPTVKIILNYPSDLYPDDNAAIMFPEDCSITLKFSGKISRLLRATYVYPVIEDNKVLLYPHWRDGTAMATNLPSCTMELLYPEKVKALIPFRNCAFELQRSETGVGYIDLNKPINP